MVTNILILSKKEIPENKFMLHEPFCLRTVKRCRLCEEIINIDDEEDHMNDNHKEIQCIFCKRKIPENLIQLHHENCGEKPAECAYCTLNLVQKEKKDHEYVCGAKTEYCQNCRQYIPIRDFEIHLIQSCFPEETYLNHQIDIRNLPVVKKKSRASIKVAGKSDIVKDTKIKRDDRDIHKDLYDKIEELKNKDKSNENIRVIEENNFKDVSISKKQEKNNVDLKEDFYSNNSGKKILMPINKKDEHNRIKDFTKEKGIIENQQNKIISYDKNDNYPSNDLSRKEKISIKNEENIKIILNKITDAQKIQNQKITTNLNSIDKESKINLESKVKNKQGKIPSKKEQNVISSNLPDSGNVRGNY